MEPGQGAAAGHALPVVAPAEGCPAAACLNHISAVAR
jgi:hypothetical protein